MNYPKEIYDPNFIPDDLLGPGDPIPRPFGYNTTVTNYFAVVFHNKIIWLYGFGDIVITDYGEFKNAHVVGGNVIVKGDYAKLQDLCVDGGSIILQGSFISANNMNNNPNPIITHIPGVGTIVNPTGGGKMKSKRKSKQKRKSGKP